MRQFVFILASTAMWGLVTPPAWCQQATSGGQDAGQSAAQSGANASSANQSSPTTPGATNQNVAPQNQSNANAGNPPGTATPQGAQPGQTGSAQNLQRRALDQQQGANQQLNEQQRRQQFDQQQLNQQQLNQQQLNQQQLNQQQLNQQQLNRQGQFPSNQFNRNATQGRSAARHGVNRLADRAMAVDRLRQRVPQFDDWRMVERDGRFWYWTPERNWMYFNDGNWTAFRQGMANQRQSLTTDNLTFPNGYPRDDWRAVNHNGRWWYWTPDETWMYFNAGRWNPQRDRSTALRRDRLRQRHGVGYRGPDGQLLDGQRQFRDLQRERTFEGTQPSDRNLRPDQDMTDPNSGMTPPTEPQPTTPSGEQPSESQGRRPGATDSGSGIGLPGAESPGSGIGLPGAESPGSGIGIPEQQSSEQSE